MLIVIPTPDSGFLWSGLEFRKESTRTHNGTSVVYLQQTRSASVHARAWYSFLGIAGPPENNAPRLAQISVSPRTNCNVKLRDDRLRHTCKLALLYYISFLQRILDYTCRAVARRALHKRASKASRHRCDIESTHKKVQILVPPGCSFFGSLLFPSKSNCTWYLG